MPELVTATDTLLLTAVLAYLLGSIPFGVLVTRAMGLGDLRKIGSGNIGATNVLRTGRKGIAAATLLLDAGKGALAVWLGLRFGNGLPVPGSALYDCFPACFVVPWLGR